MLISGKFTANFTFKEAERQWKDITTILNSMPGAKKEWKQWRKTWQDLNSRTKSKYSKIKKSMTGTGGGPRIEEIFTAADEEVINLIKPICLEGDSDIIESTSELIGIPNEGVNTTSGIESPTQNEEENLGNENNIENTKEDMASSSKVNPPQTIRKLPKRCETKFKRTQKALDSYEKVLEKKVSLKEAYYEQKLIILREKNNIIKEIGNNFVHEMTKINNFLNELI